jgi:hypothetical protein
VVFEREPNLLIMDYEPHPCFERLFAAYTGGDPRSIGMRLTHLMDRLSAADPLLVCTGSDLVLFPGSGAAPLVESFRRTTRGFIEMAAVSHLPLAVAWLARMRELSPQGAQWREPAHDFIKTIEETRAINTVGHWREAVDVDAWAGLEPKITAMVEYCCEVTADTLRAALRDESDFTLPRLCRDFFEPQQSSRVPVAMNDVMVATFALTFLDIGSRITAWFRQQNIAWERLMVLITGRSGRATAGLTWASNNMCHIIERAAEGRFPRRRLLLAPHAESIDLEAASDPARWPQLERGFRTLWFNHQASLEMAEPIFAPYPCFVPAREMPLYLSSATREVDRLPAVRDVRDREALITRLRFVLEDPSQLLSNVAADYVIDQLATNGYDPGKVFIAGFTDTDYAAALKTRSDSRE